MEDRVVALSDEDLAGALRLGGWMLAQALTSANAEIPVPLIAFTHDGLASPQLLAPNTDSELYDDQVIAGRVLTTDIESQARYWTFSYDKDLEDSGRALVVEVGVGQPLDRITFGQRYTYSEKAGLRFIGDLELVGREFLPSTVQERLGSIRWRHLFTEGAQSHDLAGQQWTAWHSARDNEQVQLHLAEFSLAIPEGWFSRRKQDGAGWVVTRLLPWEYREYEPTIITMVVTYPDQVTLENAMESQRSQLSGRRVEILKAEITKLSSPSLLSEAAYLAWNEEREGYSFRSEWVWVPTDGLGRFLLVCATSFNEASWEGVTRALDSILASLDLSDEGKSTGPRKAEVYTEPWLRRLLKKWRS